MMDLRDEIKLIEKRILEIEKKRNDTLIFEMGSLILEEMGEKPPVNDDDHETWDTKKSNFDLLILYLIKLSAEFRLIMAGEERYRLDIEKDLDKTIEYYSRIVHSSLYEWDISLITELLTIGLDCDKEVVRDYICDMLQISVEPLPVSFADAADVVWSMASFYLTGLEEGSRAIKYFYRLSDDLYRTGESELFSDFAVDTIQLLSDYNYRTREYGDRYYDKIMECSNINTGDFLWYYGLDLEYAEEYGKAKDLFDRCYIIRKNLIGEDSFFTHIAKRERAACFFHYSKDRKWKQDLYEFVDWIEAGDFQDIDEVDESQIAEVEGKTLFLVLWGFQEENYIPEYERYLELYEDICEKWEYLGQPVIQRRLAHYLRGTYYSRHGWFMKEEEELRLALSLETPKETDAVLNKEQIRNELIAVYLVQGEFDKGVPLLNELMERIDSGDQEFSLGDINYVHAIYLDFLNQVGNEDEDNQELLEIIKDELLQIENSIFEQKAEIDFNMTAIFINSAVEYMIYNSSVTAADLSCYLRLLKCVASNDSFSSFNQSMKYIVLASIINVEMLLEDRHLEVSARFFSREKLRSEQVPFLVKFNLYRLLFIYYYRKGELDEARAYINELLHAFTEEWHYYVRFVNDERLVNSFDLSQKALNGLYYVIRECHNISMTYEKLINYKQIASLAGRERNRILREYRIDEEKISQIRSLQNEIAVMESNRFVRDEALIDSKREELREMEYRVADLFPKDAFFHKIELKEAVKRVPEGSAVVEYVIYYDTDLQRIPVKNKELSAKIDIYITVNIKGNISIYRETIDKGLEIADKVTEFSDIISHEGGKPGIEREFKKNDIQQFLSQKLITPIIPYIRDSSTLFIAPDEIMTNLPFEILNIGEKSLGDNYNIIRIECIRDFLFFQDTVSGSWDNLILGDPKFELNENEINREGFENSDEGKDCDIERGSLKRLIYSSFEVDIVAKYLCGRAIKEAEVTKSTLLKGGDYRNIHIATHGFFDESDDAFYLYSSGLLFAGVSNWVRTGKISRKYGNGLITADEISRLDLHNTNLVVLSSCMSGMSDILWTKGLQGLVGSFSAAGVKYVISHLWKATDFTAAVFMERFYYLYAAEKKEPYEALAETKAYMRNLTVGEFKKTEFFRRISYCRNQKPVLTTYLRLSKMDDKAKPFRDESFWGGFSCYRCN
ncbi:MAG: CHAT domain-containing protein [Lachnospiraceae bacterium]|nr:CHAT domain-containing protein [Lachnospiraceae bacterium]